MKARIPAPRAVELGTSSLSLRVSGLPGSSIPLIRKNDGEILVRPCSLCCAVLCSIPAPLRIKPRHQRWHCPDRQTSCTPSPLHQSLLRNHGGLLRALHSLPHHCSGGRPYSRAAPSGCIGTPAACRPCPRDQACLHRYCGCAGPHQECDPGGQRPLAHPRRQGEWSNRTCNQDGGPSCRSRNRATGATKALLSGICSCRLPCTTPVRS